MKYKENGAALHELSEWIRHVPQSFGKHPSDWEVMAPENNFMIK